MIFYEIFNSIITCWILLLLAIGLTCICSSKANGFPHNVSWKSLIEFWRCILPTSAGESSFKGLISASRLSPNAETSPTLVLCLVRSFITSCCFSWIQSITNFHPIFLLSSSPKELYSPNYTLQYFPWFQYPQCWRNSNPHQILTNFIHLNHQ